MQRHDGEVLFVVLYKSYETRNALTHVMVMQCVTGLAFR